MSDSNYCIFVFKVGAMNNTKEYRMGVVKNAKMVGK